MFRKTLIPFIALSLMALPAVIWAAADQPSQSQPEVLTLEQCLDLAYQNSPSLKAAAKNIEIAKLQVREALGSFAPVVNYTIGAAKGSNPVIPGTPFTEDTNGMISVSGKLYSGGLLTAKYKTARLNLNNAVEEQRKAKQQITYTVKQAYYQVWLAEQILEVSKSSMKNAELRYKQQKGFFDVGSASKVDLLQSQVLLESMRPQVINNQNMLDAAKLNLAILIGIEKDRPYTVNIDLAKLQLPDSTKITLETILEEAYKNRPDVRQMKNTVEISKLGTKMAWAGVKPSLTLTNTFLGVNPAIDGAYNFNPGDWQAASKSWTLSLNLAGILFDGFVAEGKIAEAKKNEELTAIKNSSLQDQVRVDVELAIQSLNAGLASARASQATIDLAKESLRLIQAKFDAGMATNMDINDAQVKLDQALNGYYSGLASYLTAQAKFDMVTGKDN